MWVGCLKIKGVSAVKFKLQFSTMFENWEARVGLYERWTVTCTPFCCSTLGFYLPSKLLFFLSKIALECWIGVSCLLWKGMLPISSRLLAQEHKGREAKPLRCNSLNQESWHWFRIASGNYYSSGLGRRPMVLCLFEGTDKQFTLLCPLSIQTYQRPPISSHFHFFHNDMPLSGF